MPINLLATLIVCASLFTASAVADESDPGTIIDVAVDAGSFSTLAKALSEADLIEVLQGKGPFTVFAPTDDAFAKLPDGTIEKLLEPEGRDVLISILKTHVVAGEVESEPIEPDTAA